ncbi:MAG: C40 family peptidase [Zoogloea sp.]|nr:C40 family peptidase [Zoogloea sp.]
MFSRLSRHLIQPSALVLSAALSLLIAGCGSTPARSYRQPEANKHYFALADASHAREIVIYAVGLMDTGYLFGGRNPEAGLDCSGMVSFVVEEVSGQRLPHNSAQIAEQTRPVAPDSIQPGDLVFFNTSGRPYSHMGIYVGDGRFIHAPNSKGKVRMDRIDSSYFSQRLDGARTLIARRSQG